MDTPPPLAADRHALFLDFDGVLVGFVDDPADVRIEPPALDRLMRLQPLLGGALAVVSGRRIADLDRFLSPLCFAAAGIHGLERRSVPGGATEVLAGPDMLADIRASLREVAGREPRLRLEDKGTALVLHYRTAPELAVFAESAMREAVGGREDVVMMSGKSIVEVHPAGMDKGIAVAAFMGEVPFAGRVPVYIGDDTTDEFALRFVRESGGVSIKVGSSPSVAEFRLPDIRAVHRWLGA